MRTHRLVRHSSRLVAIAAALGLTIFVAQPATAAVPLIPVAMFGATTGGYDGGKMALDPALGRLYTTSYGDNTVDVVDVATNLVTHSIKLGSGTLEVEVDKVSHRVYVGHQLLDNQSVTVMDGVTFEVVGIVTIPGKIQSIAVDSRTGTAFVADGTSGTITVIDGVTGLAGAPIAVGSGADAMTVDEAAGVLYVGVSDYTSTSGILVIDVTTGSRVATYPQPFPVSDLLYVPSAHLLYIGAADAFDNGAPAGTLTVVDPATFAVERSATLPGQPIEMAADGNGRLWAVLYGPEFWFDALDASSLEIIASDSYDGFTFLASVEVDPLGRGAYLYFGYAGAGTLYSLPDQVTPPQISWPTDCRFRVDPGQFSLPFRAWGADLVFSLDGSLPPDWMLGSELADPNDLNGNAPAHSTFDFTVTVSSPYGSDDVACTLTTEPDSPFPVASDAPIAGLFPFLPNAVGAPTPTTTPDQATSDPATVDPEPTTSATPTTSAALTTTTAPTRSGVTVEAATRSDAAAQRLAATGPTYVGPLLGGAIGLIATGYALTAKSRRRRMN